MTGAHPSKGHVLSPTRLRALVALIAVASLSAMVALGGSSASAAPSYTKIEGTGSSWSANAINTWVADVLSQGMQVTFSSSGSAQGRKDFANRANDFGVSDIGFQGTDAGGNNDTSQGRPFAYLPIAAGGTSIIYNLKSAGEQIRTLRLSGETVTKIFTSKITKWNDPQIMADNPGLSLPGTTIVPVVHAEASGSTAQLSRYMAKQYPDLWRAYAPEAFSRGGVDAGQVEIFPLKSGTQTIAQNGSDQVINYVTSGSGDGTIGYDEYSYALGKNWPAAKILNAAGYYTLPTQYNVAKALTAAVIDLDPNSPTYLLQNLDGVYGLNAPPVYPISSYSYMILPVGASPAETRMSSSKRQTLADFLYYSICQGQGEIGPIGYSSLPINLVQAGFEQIAKLKAADASIDLSARDVANCQNPTFDGSDPSINRLAVLAPTPPDCDRVGANNCAVGQNASNNNPNPAGSEGAQPGGATTDAGPQRPAGSEPTPGAAAPAADPTAAATTSSTRQIDPETGQEVGGSGDGSSGEAKAVSTELLASRTNGPVGVLGPLAVLELLAALFVPVVLAQYLSRNRRPS